MSYDVAACLYDMLMIVERPYPAVDRLSEDIMLNTQPIPSVILLIALL